MRVFKLFFGLLLVAIFVCGLADISFNGLLNNNLSDIRNNYPLSVAILVFVSVSLICNLFLQESIAYLSGIIAGLAIATFLTGFQYSLGLSVLMYSVLIKDLPEKTHNKFKNENASEAGSDAA